MCFSGGKTCFVSLTMRDGRLNQDQLAHDQAKVFPTQAGKVTDSYGLRISRLLCLHGGFGSRFMTFFEIHLQFLFV